MKATDASAGTAVAQESRRGSPREFVRGGGVRRTAPSRSPPIARRCFAPSKTPGNRRCRNGSPLDAALQKRLSAIGKFRYRWQTRQPGASPRAGVRSGQSSVAPAARDGDRRQRRAVLTAAPARARRSAATRSRPDLLRNIVQLVGLVHAETCAGDPARKEMPALIKQTTKLLNARARCSTCAPVYLHEYGRARSRPPRPNGSPSTSALRSRRPCQGRLQPRRRRLDRRGRARQTPPGVRRVFDPAKLKDDADPRPASRDPGDRHRGRHGRRSDGDRRRDRAHQEPRIPETRQGNSGRRCRQGKVAAQSPADRGRRRQRKSARSTSSATRRQRFMPSFWRCPIPRRRTSVRGTNGRRPSSRRPRRSW